MLKLTQALYIIVLLFLIHTPLFATQTTYTFYPTEDTFIKDNGKNENEGMATNLRIQHPDRSSHLLLKFSASSITSTVGTNHVISANLKLYVETNFNNWGSGTLLDLHRLQYDWTEAAATFNCPADLNLGNTQPDCDEMWDGGYYDKYISASLLHQNNQTGWKIYNVTSEVQLIQNGIEFYGWLIRKRDPAANGSLDYTSIQGTAAFKPRLEVTIDTQTSCSPTAIYSITPSYIPPSGSPQSINISGVGLDRIVEVSLDGSSVSYNIVNSTTLNFSVTYPSAGTHTLAFKSNCLNEPLKNYVFEVSSDDPGPDACEESCFAAKAAGQNDYCTFVANSSHITVGSGGRLRWAGSDTSLVGYYDFDKLTNNPWYGSGGTTRTIEDFFGSLQYRSSGTKGVNFIRAVATGYSNSDDSSPGGSVMPFKKAGSIYNIHATATSGPPLSGTFINRLRRALQSARKNGILVQITLFDAEYLESIGHWFDNPWHPNNNNLDNNGCNNLNGLDTGFDNYAFYKIFNANDSLNCLGLAQKNYVQKLVSAVQTSCNDAPCRNVLFEVMNEATYENNRTGNPDPVLFGKWHRTVASWIRTCGNYIVTGSTGNGGVYPESNPNIHPAETAVFGNGNIRLVSLHYGQWNGDPCKAIDKFRGVWSGKPVVIDDDGNPPGDDGRNVRCDVFKWAFKCLSKPGDGIAHYLHLDDAQDLAYVCEPAASAKNPDCNKIDILGNTGLTNLCGSTWIGNCSGPLNFCPPNCSISCTTPSNCP